MLVAWLTVFIALWGCGYATTRFVLIPRGRPRLIRVPHIAYILFGSPKPKTTPVDWVNFGGALFQTEAYLILVCGVCMPLINVPRGAQPLIALVLSFILGNLMLRCLTLEENSQQDYWSLVPQIPSGFEWKILPDKNLAVVIPDGWFFKEETRAELKLDGVYVTKENIDEAGRFSTGLSILIFKDFASNNEASQFAQDLLAKQVNLETTKEILKAWDYKSGSAIIHHLRIRAEFPEETEVNRKKIIRYSTSIAHNSVYWLVFESPESLWEETVKNYGLVPHYVVLFGN